MAKVAIRWALDVGIDTCSSGNVASVDSAGVVVVASAAGLSSSLTNTTPIVPRAIQGQ